MSAEARTAPPQDADSAAAHRPNLDDVFGDLLDGLPAEIASAEGKGRARALARRLPPASMIFVEYPLSGPPGGVDLAVRVTGYDDNRAIIEGRHPTIMLSQELRNDPVWGRAAAFCAAWRDRTNPLSRLVDMFGLEFDDRSAETAGPPQPLIYFSHPRAATLSDMLLSTETAHGRDPFDWVTRVAMPILVGAEQSAALKPAVRRWLLRPQEARLRHVGVMLGRPNAPLRLCLRMAVAELSRQLVFRAGVEDGAALAETIREISGQDAGHVVLHIDLAPELGPTIGFEVAPEEDSRFPLIMRRLVAAGLCDAARAEATLAWRATPDGLDDLIRGSRLVMGVPAVLAEGRRALEKRRLNHVKLTRRADGSLTAKAYLAALRYAPRADALF